MLKMTMSNSKNSIDANKLVSSLQDRFVNALNNLSDTLGEKKHFEKVTWFRDNGSHGGGSRYESRDNILFNTASVNVSQVHYDDVPDKALRAATAISTIIHPKNPNVPSIHIHISLTQLANGNDYWRLMADLNPSIINEDDKKIFEENLRIISADTFKEGIAQGDKYFNIPALNKHRGVSHFYLENYTSGDETKDSEFALSFGQGVIDNYIEIIKNAFQTRTTFSNEDIQAQLAYHTSYLFQVLTLDRGTTSGLLVHNQNDLGIMGSLPSFVNKKLLLSWASKVNAPQNELVENLATCLDDSGVVNESVKLKLAKTVRVHFGKYPEALKYQASGNTIPNTVGNHSK